MGYDIEMDDYHEDKEHKEKELRPSFFDKLSKDEQKELDKLLKDVLKEAKAVVEDYANNPSQISGSIVQVHESSPILKKDKK